MICYLVASKLKTFGVAEKCGGSQTNLHRYGCCRCCVRLKEISDVRYRLYEISVKTPMTVLRGKVHDYLGMVLDFSTSREIVIDMIEYVKGILHGA